MSSGSVTRGQDSTLTVETPQNVKATGNYLWTVMAALAMERNRGTANAYGLSLPVLTVTPYNPHTAANVPTLTPAALGATEVLITSSPCIFYGIEWMSDTAAGSLLLYNKNATGNAPTAGTLIPFPVLYAVGQQFHGPVGKKMDNGMTVVGTALGLCCNVLWALQ